MTIPHLSTIDPLEMHVLNNYVGDAWIIRKPHKGHFRILRATFYNGQWHTLGKYSTNTYHMHEPLRELAPDEVLSLYLEGKIPS